MQFNPHYILHAKSPHPTTNRTPSSKRFQETFSLTRLEMLKSTKCLSIWYRLMYFIWYISEMNPPLSPLYHDTSLQTDWNMTGSSIVCAHRPYHLPCADGLFGILRWDNMHWVKACCLAHIKNAIIQQWRVYYQYILYSLLPHTAVNPHLDSQPFEDHNIDDHVPCPLQPLKPAFQESPCFKSS